jgi:hypothetical protein
VYALRWENSRNAKAGWGPAVKGGWANTRRLDRELLAFTDEVTAEHLRGSEHVGLYPMLRDDRCWAVRQIPVRCWLGLTATPYRRDGLQALMCMHCGPVRHRMAEPPQTQLLHR